MPAPTVTPPASQTVVATGGTPVTIDYATATTTGGTAPVTVRMVPPSGSLFRVGTTPVSCLATGADGLVGSGTVNMIVSLSYPTGQLPAFPGAEGFGTTTRHAYAGTVTPKVIRVNTLADNTTALVTNGDGTLSGSFRMACLYSGPRVIVFERSGYINLKPLGIIQLVAPYCWIAGATAPAPGISLRGDTLQLRQPTHDVLVQHIRSRPGEESPLVTNGGQGPSAFGVYGQGGVETPRLVFDHCSAAWASDASYDFNNCGDATVSNCLSAEQLRYAGHPRPILITYESNRVAVVRSIMSSGGNRLPAFSAGARGISVNNLIYDQYQTIGTLLSTPDGTGRTVICSIAGNRYIQGPTPPTTGTTLYVITVQSTTPPGSKLYKSDNTWTGSRYDAAAVTYPGAYRNDASFDPVVSTPPTEAPISGISTILLASQVEAFVLARAGAFPAMRDTMDQRIITNIRNRTQTSTNIQTENDVGGYAAAPLAQNTQAFALPTNPHTVTASGYTNLEVYIHSLNATVEGL